MNPYENGRNTVPYFVYASVGLVSASALAYEILLMRLLSVIHWHHFAYMIISLALLGYGASGTFLALFKDRLLAHFERSFRLTAGLFGISTIAGFSAAGYVPFNGLELIWNPRQLLHLLSLFLILAVPFFFAANCVGLAFMRSQQGVHRIYLSDLLGAGIGALGIVGLLFALPLDQCVKLLAIAGLIAAGMPSRAWWAADGRYRSVWLASIFLTAAIGGVVLWPAPWSAPRISEYKGLPQTLHVVGTEVLSEHSSPLGLLAVVRSPSVPFRYVPGLSLMASSEPPAQLAVFTDGDGMSVITRYDGDRERLAYLDEVSSALPYHLLNKPKVLVLGAGGGASVLQAITLQARAIDAVELNPQMVDLLEGRYAEFSGDLYGREEVRIHLAEARGFVAASRERYDLIDVGLLDGFAASGAGVHAQSESYLYTVEAIQEYYRHLRPGGILAITRWLKLPPRDTLKIFATVVEALERSDVSDPGTRLALIRSWQTSTLLVKNGPFSEGDIAAIRDFCSARSFDLSYYPGMQPSEANRYNVLERPYLFEGARALLGERRDGFFEDYKFNIRPATDNQPYFFHFFKWGVLPELVKLRAQGGLLLLDSGYVILIATLFVAALLSVFLILLPLAVVRRSESRARTRSRVAFYFLALGLAFLFIEIAFIQRFTLYLGHPLYAVAVVLCAFLLFAGLGSGTSAWVRKIGARWRISPIALAATSIVSLAVFYLLVLTPIFQATIAWPDMAKVAITVFLIAPLAFFMGMPFPMGLSRLVAESPGLIPWAWGINGCGSVLSAILATLLAMHLGFAFVVGIAAVLYISAAFVFYNKL